MAPLSKSRQPKWLQSLTLKPHAHSGPDLDFMIKTVRSSLDPARERGDNVGAASLSWQLDQLLKMRHEGRADS